MRPNPVKDRLAAGETLYGTMIFEFLSAGLPQILQGAGADFVFYDMEHSGFSYSEIKHQLALCRGLDIVPLVRPRATTHEHTAQLLDLGAMGMLFRCLAHLEQQTHGSQFQQLGSVLVGRCSRPNERHDVKPPAQRKLLLDLAIGEAAVFHVIENEVGTRSLQNLR